MGLGLRLSLSRPVAWLQAARLPATRYRLQATGYRLRAAGYGWVYQAVSKACDPRGKSTAMLRLYLVGVRVS